MFVSGLRDVNGERMACDMASSLLRAEVPSARSSTAARGSRLLLELDAAMVGRERFESAGRPFTSSAVSVPGSAVSGNYDSLKSHARKQKSLQRKDTCVADIRYVH